MIKPMKRLFWSDASPRFKNLFGNAFLGLVKKAPASVEAAPHRQADKIL